MRLVHRDRRAAARVPVGEGYRGSGKTCLRFTAEHDEVRDAIRKHKLMSIRLLRCLRMRSTDGCASCRPAINYYLYRPGLAGAGRSHPPVNDACTRTSRGRTSGHPGCGGRTNASSCGLADVVASTDPNGEGHRRAAHRSPRREEAGHARRVADLDMPSGHAYAKALRTVKTCVGSEWCRYGTQDSTAMGKALERALWRMYAPHKVKLAVSGCPRNCAESGIKDVGVIAVESGWEIYVAGNGGIKTEVAQFMVKVQTSADVLSSSRRVLEPYRQEVSIRAHRSFRRGVGLDYVKRRIARRRGTAGIVGATAVCARRRADPWHQPREAGVDCGNTLRSMCLMNGWIEICALADIRVSVRASCSAAAQFRSRCFARARTRCCAARSLPASRRTVVAGLVAGDRVVCPLHGWTIELPAPGRRARRGLRAGLCGRVAGWACALREADLAAVDSVVPRRRGPSVLSIIHKRHWAPADAGMTH